MVERPTSATMIGWLFIGLSILMVFSGLMAAVVWSLTPDEEVPRSTDVFEHQPWAFRLMFKMFDYIQYLIAVQLVLAASGVAGGIGLLQLRSWGRALTELLTWLGLVYVVGYSFLWLTGVASFRIGEAASPEIGFIPVLMLVMGIVLFITFLIPFTVVLVALRGKKIRSAIELKSREMHA